MSGVSEKQEGAVNSLEGCDKAIRSCHILGLTTPRLISWTRPPLPRLIPSTFFSKLFNETGPKATAAMSRILEEFVRLSGLPETSATSITFHGDEHKSPDSPLHLRPNVVSNSAGLTGQSRRLIYGYTIELNLNGQRLEFNVMSNIRSLSEKDSVKTLYINGVEFSLSKSDKLDHNVLPILSNSEGTTYFANGTEASKATQNGAYAFASFPIGAEKGYVKIRLPQDPTLSKEVHATWNKGIGTERSIERLRYRVEDLPTGESGRRHFNLELGTGSGILAVTLASNQGNYFVESIVKKNSEKDSDGTSAEMFSVVQGPYRHSAWGISSSRAITIYGGSGKTEIKQETDARRSALVR